MAITVSAGGTTSDILPAVQEQSRGGGLASWIAAIVAVVLLHRIAIFAAFHSELREFVEANTDWLTWQYLLPRAMLEHFFASLLYLQQTPPIPNAILGVAELLFGPGSGRTYFCLALQASITAGSAALMLYILHKLTRLRLLPWLFAVVWALGIDNLTMEYNSQGQTFYENLAMLMLLWIVWLFMRWQRHPSVRGAAMLGLAVSLLALTRATFSYFFVVPLLFLLLCRPGRRQIAAYLLGALLLQGAWCLKNGIIYGHTNLATSSWKGLNLAIGLTRTGHGERLQKFILEHRSNYPDWFVHMTESEGIVLWELSGKQNKYLPDDLRQRDAQVFSATGGTNRLENFPSIVELSSIYTSVYVAFAWAEPEIILDKFARSYWLMWQPIHTYSSMFLDFFHTMPAEKTAPPDRYGSGPAGALERYATLYVSENSNQLMIEHGKFPDLSSRPGPLLTIPYLPGAIGFANLLFFHLGLLLIPWLFLSRDSSTREIRRVLLLLAGTIAYLAVVSSISEHGENMRFRLSVEPLLWINSFLLIFGTFEVCAKVAVRRRAAHAAANGADTVE